MGDPSTQPPEVGSANRLPATNGRPLQAIDMNEDAKRVLLKRYNAWKRAQRKVLREKEALEDVCELLAGPNFQLYETEQGLALVRADEATQPEEEADE